MQYVVLGIHLFICIGLIGLVLLQRSEGGALGMGGGGGGSLMTGRGAADALARMTTFAGGFFLITSLLLTFLSGAAQSNSQRSIFDLLPSSSQEAPATLPAAPTTEPTTPDPTQSSLPAEDSQLASTNEIAPAPASASTRAGPVTQQPATAAPTTRSTPAATTTSAPRTAAPTTNTTTTTQRRPATQPAQTTTSGATTAQPPAILELPPEQLAPESGDVGDGIDTPIRRERAGPDQ